MELGQFLTNDDVWNLEPFEDWKENYLFWCKRYMIYKINNLSTRFLKDDEKFDLLISQIENCKNIEALKEEINELSKIKVKGAKSYFIVLYNFYLFLIEAKLTNIKNIHKKSIDGFINYLDVTVDKKTNRGEKPQYLSVATKENYVARVRNFVKFINEHNILNDGDDSFEIKLDSPSKGLLKKNSKRIDIISPDKEYTDFLNGVDEIVFKHDNIRNKLLLKIALFTGMRVSEITYLKYKDIEIQGNQFAFNIVGKGNKERTLYVNKKDINSLWTQYLKERPILNPDDYAFANSKGEPLADRTVSNYVRKILALKNIKTTKKGLHLIRHSLSTKLIFSGEHSLEDVSAILGHEDIATTQIYTHITNEHIKKTAKGISSVINKDYKASK